MKKEKVSKATIIRTVVLFVALINGGLAMFGKQMIPVGEEDVEIAVNSIYASISAVAVVIAAVITWWKDNNFTKKAKKKEAEAKKWGM